MATKDDFSFHSAEITPIRRRINRNMLPTTEALASPVHSVKLGRHKCAPGKERPQPRCYTQYADRGVRHKVGERAALQSLTMQSAVHKSTAHASRGSMSVL